MPAFASSHTVPRKFVVVIAVLVLHAAVLWLVQWLPTKPPVQQAPVLQWVQPMDVTLAGARPTGRDTAAASPTPARQPAPQAAQNQPLANPTPVLAARTPPAPMPTPMVVANDASALQAGASAGAEPAATAVADTAASTLTNGSALLAAPGSSSQVELPSKDADYLHNPLPEIPRLSILRNEQGRVVVAALIDLDGRAQQPYIKVSSGYARLDDAALATVKAWRYVPGKRGGVPVAMWYDIPFTFSYTN